MRLNSFIANKELIFQTQEKETCSGIDPRQYRTGFQDEEKEKRAAN